MGYLVIQIKIVVLTVDLRIILFFIFFRVQPFGLQSLEAIKLEGDPVSEGQVFIGITFSLLDQAVYPGVIVEEVVVFE